MGLNNRYIVLYFMKGPMPSEAQITEARQFGPHVMFRNAMYHTPGETGMEPCTAVAGEVPSDYARKYPKAVSYADWIDGKLPVIVEAPKRSRSEPPPDLGFKIAARGAPGGMGMPMPPGLAGPVPGFGVGSEPEDVAGAPAGPGAPPPPPPPPDWTPQG